MTRRPDSQPDGNKQLKLIRLVYPASQDHA